MSALIVSQVPDKDHATSIGTNQLPLGRVDDNVVDGVVVGISSLDQPSPGVPNFDCAVLGAGHHPFAFAVECDSGDVVRMAFKGHYGVRVARLDVVQTDYMPSSSSKELFVWSDA